MTTADLLERISTSDRTASHEEGMRACGRCLLAAVKEALVRGDGIELRGFGAFKVRRAGPARPEPPGPASRLKFRSAIRPRSGPEDFFEVGSTEG